MAEERMKKPSSGIRRSLTNKKLSENTQGNGNLPIPFPVLFITLPCPYKFPKFYPLRQRLPNKNKGISVFVFYFTIEF